MSHVLFKQSFKPRAAPGTPGANVAHLSYIATRPGAVYNPECGFGLWGQLPGNGAMRYQDLETAKEIVREASEDHTLYRAIVSVGQADAEAKGLYDIGRWQDLIADHMADVAKAMDIAPEKLAWCASFHHAKGHPHCHILYWDTGTDPRPEALPRKEWTAKAERIRAAFSESLFREEIRQAQKAEREEEKALRETLQALCLESCPAEGEDLAQVLRSPRLESVERAMQELIDGLPRKGSLRYAYLPPDYKAKVDALVEEVLKFPALQKNLENCLACTRQVAEGYSNGPEATEQAVEKERNKLRTALGNTVMDHIRSCMEELRTTGRTLPDTAAIVERAVTLARQDPDYAALLARQPRDRIPRGNMDSWPIARLARKVVASPRIRETLRGYCLGDLDLAGRERAKAGEPALFGKAVTEAERDAYDQRLRDAEFAVRQAVREMLREDSGWQAEALRTQSAMLVLSVAKMLSLAARQQEAKTKVRPLSRDRSKEAKKDRKRQNEEYEP